MKKNIFISLKSIQWQDGEKTETELITKAELLHENNRFTISYQDTEATGFEGCSTTIQVNSDKSASIIRTGTANSVLSLETGKKHFCQYGTPYGFMQIGVYTHAIDNKLDENGSLYMKYTLDLNSSYLSDNEIIMAVQNKI